MNNFVDTTMICNRHFVLISLLACVCCFANESARAQNRPQDDRQHNRSVWLGQRQRQEGPPRDERGRSRPDRRGQRNRDDGTLRQGIEHLGRHRDRPDQGWQQLSKKQRSQITQFLETYFPRMSVDLKNLRRRNPEAFKRRMRRVMPEIRQVMDMMQVNPQRASLHIQHRRLDMQLRQKAHRYRKSTDVLQQKKLRKEIHDIAAQAFDVQINLRQMEIKDIQARLSEMKKRIDETREMRPQMIRQRVDMLLSTKHGPGAVDVMAQPVSPR